MNNLFEVVFEEINIKKIESCLKVLTGNGKEVINYNFSSSSKDDIIINFDEKSNIRNVFAENKGGSLFINLNKLVLEFIEIPKCSLRIISYDSKYDFEIHFDLEYINYRDKLFNELRKFSSFFAEDCEAKKYYAGFESAYEEENRIYTNNEIGPNKL